MKWFDKWFAKKCKQVWDSGEELLADVPIGNVATAKQRRGLGMVTAAGSTELHSRGVTFTLYKANGGHVVELRDYDPQTDRHTNSLHLVPSDKDMGEALNHIITYEALKR